MDRSLIAYTPTFLTHPYASQIFICIYKPEETQEVKQKMNCFSDETYR